MFAEKNPHRYAALFYLVMFPPLVSYERVGSGECKFRWSVGCLLRSSYIRSLSQISRCKKFYYKLYASAVEAIYCTCMSL